MTVLWLTGGIVAAQDTNAVSQQSKQNTPAIQVKPADGDGIRWFLPYEAPFRLAGFAWFGQDQVYQRLPVAKPETVTQYPSGKVTSVPAKDCGAFYLSSNTAGGQVQFRTDSTQIWISGELLSKNRLDNVSDIGSSGFDLYYREGEKEPWKLGGVSRYGHGATKFQVVLGSPMVRQMRDCLIHFPTYNGVRSLAIGLDEKACLEAPKDWTDTRRIVYYGTSITQGASASRPGMACANILSRDLGMEVFNYGFSGNGKGEPEIAQMLASIPNVGVFILDYDWNIGTGAEMGASLPPFLDVLRKTYPTGPVLVVSHSPGAFEGVTQATETRKNFADKKQVAQEIVTKRKAAGDKNLYFLDGGTFFGEDWWECLADGTHASDLGFYRMEKILSPVVKDILSHSKAVGTTSQKEKDSHRSWPFIISRQMSSINYQPDVMNQIFDSFRDNPGSCDEIWFCIDGLTDLEASKAELERLLPFRQRCQPCLLIK